MENKRRFRPNPEYRFPNIVYGDIINENRKNDLDCQDLLIRFRIPCPFP
jgi:hypothetical protein